MPENSIVFFKDGDISLDVPISPDKDTVWLTANQMAVLFDKDEKTVRKHINNVFSDEELSIDINTQKMRVVGVKQLVPFYTLDVIAIYQSFDGKDVYPTDQEKAANLLYMMVKNHAFNDGNKRIAAAVFIYFLDKRGILYKDNGVLMIALSHPNEKEMMCLLVMNMLENE